MQMNAIGIAWYRQEDYDRLKAMFPDGDVLPDTFDSWRQKAQQLVLDLVGERILVKKAYIDPEMSPEWCRARGLAMDAQARTLYAQ